MRVWKNSTVSEHEVIWKIRGHSSDPASSVKSRYLLTIAAVTKFLRKILCYTGVEMIILKCKPVKWGVKYGIY
jgi:hypothetical protein